ncbi:transposase [Ktedonobacter sp. SOSP1-85]|uniref:IS110 family transposase n=1 Tax=Ktedonobacter sp. SOSP1-85 TaxID=2778367 RepID=UPI001F46B18B|nr:transposase [Ktedonobacter sp. SOSP1-85]
MVAHPNLVKLITTARVKTDARDTLHLARLLAAGLMPAVWIPPQDERELRGLIAHRTRLIRQRTQVSGVERLCKNLSQACGRFLQRS